MENCPSQKHFLWYKIGNGEDITVDASKLDLNFLNTSELEIGKEYDGIQTWNGGLGQGLVYGGINIIYEGNNQVKILSDIYDFDIHPWSLKEAARNIETIGADEIHGKGTSFSIKFKETVGTLITFSLRYFAQ